jgi:hypothetical protein
MWGIYAGDRANARKMHLYQFMSFALPPSQLLLRRPIVYKRQSMNNMLDEEVLRGLNT